VTATGLRTRIAATTSGYALAVGSGAKPLTLYRMSPVLAPLGSPLQLAAIWNDLGGGLAASGDTVAALWIDGGQISLMIVDALGVPGAKIRADAPTFTPTYRTLGLARAADPSS